MGGLRMQEGRRRGQGGTFGDQGGPLSIYILLTEAQSRWCLAAPRVADRSLFF